MTDAKVRLEPPDAFDRVERRIHKASDTARVEFRKLGPTGEALLRATAPRQSGEYARQITSDVKGDTIRVYSKARHRTAVEIGRRPGRMPPPREVARKLGIPISEAFLVARAIGRRGTKGLHPVQKAQGAMGTVVNRAAGQIAEAMKNTVEAG